MAGFIKNVLNSMKLDDDYEEEFEPSEEFDDLDYSDEPKAPVNKPISRKAPTTKYDSTLDLDEEEYSPKKTFRPARKQPSHDNVVQFRKPGQSEVVMFRPSVFSDAKEIADTLLLGRAVVMNLEGLNIDLAQRITDFAAGASYSMGGDIQSISRYIFIVAPSNIDLSGDFAGSIMGGSDSININI